MPTSAPTLRLLDGFALTIDGNCVPVQHSGQRLLAFLALHPQPLLRAYVAYSLWMGTPEVNAQASLRSSLWRLRKVGARLVDIEDGHLQLSARVETDVRQLVQEANHLLGGASLPEPCGQVIERLRGNLLPGWCEDWVVDERECLRQLQLHALEGLARRLYAEGRLVEALEAGLAAVAAEPLRETAQRLLISIHLAEGNRSEAIRQYRTYRRLVHEELGIEPSPDLERLVGCNASRSPVPTASGATDPSRA